MGVLTTQKSDEMILAFSLYNKISEKYSNKELIEKNFKMGLQKLLDSGHIHEESAKDSLYVLCPKERNKQIEEYQNQGREKSLIGYSKNVDQQEMQNLIDDVLSDNPSRSFRESIGRENINRAMRSSDYGRSPC